MYTKNPDGSITTPGGRTVSPTDGTAYTQALIAWGAQAASQGQSSSTKGDPSVFMGTNAAKGTHLFKSQSVPGVSLPDDWQVPGGVQRAGSLVQTGPDGQPVPTPTRSQAEPKPHTSVMSQTAALNAPLSWGEKRIQSAIRGAQSLGYNVTTFADFLKVWQDAVKQAALAYNNGDGKKLSPWDMMRLLATGNGLPSKDGSGSGASAPFTGTRTQTSTNTSVDDVDPGSAAAIIDASLSQYLGRAATDAEKADFLSRATGLARANPTVTKQVTSTDYKNGEAVNQDTTSSQSGGVTSDDLAEAAKEQAQASPDYGAYQAAGTIYGWLQSALGAAA